MHDSKMIDGAGIMPNDIWSAMAERHVRQEKEMNWWERGSNPEPRPRTRLAREIAAVVDAEDAMSGDMVMDTLIEWANKQPDLVSSAPDLHPIEVIANRICKTVIEKDKTYKGSWKQRGGVGAFMMLARKWDRIQNMVEEYARQYDILHRGEQELVQNKPEGVIEDMQDLVGYLLLVLAECYEKAQPRRFKAQKLEGTIDTSHPQGSGYVDQDGES